MKTMSFAVATAWSSPSRDYRDRPNMIVFLANDLGVGESDTTTLLETEMASHAGQGQRHAAIQRHVHGQNLATALSRHLALNK